MAQSDYVTTAIRVPITGTRSKPSTSPIRVTRVECVAGAAQLRRPSAPDPMPLDRHYHADHWKRCPTALSVYATAILDHTAENVPGSSDLGHFDAELAELSLHITGTMQRLAGAAWRVA
jgi:hypothetical protein